MGRHLRLGDPERPSLDGERYQARFDELTAAGTAVHGEADLVCRRGPRSVLDVGCGTGRVSIELAHRGVEAVGVDRDASMLAVARRRGPGIVWVEADMTGLDLHRRFDVVLMAGNVPLFTPPGTEASLVAACARHVRSSGLVIAGFQLGRGYEVDDYDADCAAAGLELVERFSTWDEDAYAVGDGYAVSVHRPHASEA